MDPDVIFSVSLLGADAKVLIEMQEEDLRHRNSPGQATQMGRKPIQPVPNVPAAVCTCALFNIAFENMKFEFCYII